MRVRLIENGAAAFIPGSLIVDNKERIECSGELGVVNIDKVREYQLGDSFEVKLTEVRTATRQLVARPVQQFPAPKAEVSVEEKA
nr:S1 RNA-binding domain-containing protein [Photobacterium swingsii]